MRDTETTLTAGVTIEERVVTDGERIEDVVCVRFYLASGEVRETWFAVEDMHAISRYWLKRHPILARTGGRTSPDEA